MPDTVLSKRKLESYRRAEVVAQASRKMIQAGPRVTEAELELLASAVIDWMDVTGKEKFAEPVRRSKKKHPR